MKLSRYYFSILASSRVKLSLVSMTRLYANYSWPQGGTLILFIIHVRRLWPFWGFKTLNCSIFGVNRKMSIFGSMKVLWIFLWGPHKMTSFYVFWGLFLRLRYKMGIFFWLLNFQIHFGVFDISDISLGEQ